MTRRTQFTGTAESRRREARKHLQALPVNDFSTGMDVSPAAPSKAELTCKRLLKMGRVDKAVSVHTTKTYDTLSNCCLPEVAIFSVKSKKTENITARV